MRSETSDRCGSRRQAWAAVYAVWLWLLLGGVCLATPAWSAQQADQATHQAKTILVFGDSLSAAHGIPQQDGWVALLQRRLAADRVDVVNASISGETTAGGLARLPAALARTHPDIVILELGANDGLQALPLSAMKHNLTAMIDDSRNAGARVLLLGMRIPPNYGPDYTQKFHAVFDQLAQQYRLAYDPFFLAPIATDRSQFQADGLHPVASAEPLLLHRILKTLQPMIHDTASAPTSSSPGS